MVWKATGEPIVDLEVDAIEIWLDSIVRSLQSISARAPEREPLRFKGKTHTDDEGRFLIKGLHSRAIIVLGFGAGTDKVAFRIVDRVPAPGERLDLGLIELLARGAVSGTVVDSKGAPLVDQRVRVADLPTMMIQVGLAGFDPAGLLLIKDGPKPSVFPLPAWIKRLDARLPFAEARTDANGKFDVKGVRPGQNTVIILPPVGVPLARRVVVRAGKTSKMRTIKIKPGQSLRGRVVDSDGEPVSGVNMTAGDVKGFVPVSFLKKPVTTDEEGKFAVKGLGKNKVWLVLQREAGASWESYGQHRAGDDVEIVLPKTYQGLIRVVDHTRRPVTNVDFDLMLADEAAMMLPGFQQHLPVKKHISKVLETPGTWKVEALPAGKYLVLARAKKMASFADTLELKAGEPAVLEIMLKPAASLRFKVENREGRGVAAARVYWSMRRSRSATKYLPKDRAARMPGLPVLLGKTNAKGILDCDAIDVDAKSFFVRHPAYALGFAKGRGPSAEEEIVFVLRRGGHVEGHVVEGGTPIKEPKTLSLAPTWRLSQKFEGALMPRFTVTTPDGRFMFKNVDPGKWRLMNFPDIGNIGSSSSIMDFFTKMEGGRFGRHTIAVEVREDQTENVIFELKPVVKNQGTSSIQGSVNIDGLPAAGLEVGTWSARFRRVKTDELGQFRFDGMKEGSHNIWVRRMDLTRMNRDRLWNGTVKVAKGETATLAIDILTTTLRVEVIDHGGEVLPAVMLRLSGAQTSRNGLSGTSKYAALTDAAGIAEFQKIATGSYQVRLGRAANMQGYALPKTVLEVSKASRFKRETLRLVKAVKLSGTVRWELSHLSLAARELVEGKPGSKRRRNRGQIWMQFGNDRWTQVRERDGHFSFEVEGLRPGMHQTKAWRRNMRWLSAEMIFTVDQQNVVIVMRPEPKALKNFLAMHKARNRKKGAQKK